MKVNRCLFLFFSAVNRQLTGGGEERRTLTACQPGTSRYAEEIVANGREGKVLKTGRWRLIAMDWSWTDRNSTHVQLPHHGLIEDKNSDSRSCTAVSKRLERGLGYGHYSWFTAVE